MPRSKAFNAAVPATSPAPGWQRQKRCPCARRLWEGAPGHTRGWCSSWQSGRAGDGCAGWLPALLRGSGLWMCHVRMGALGQHLCIRGQVGCFHSCSFSTNGGFSLKLHNAKCNFSSSAWSSSYQNSSSHTMPGEGHTETGLPPWCTPPAVCQGRRGEISPSGYSLPAGRGGVLKWILRIGQKVSYEDSLSFAGSSLLLAPEF